MATRQDRKNKKLKRRAVSNQRKRNENVTSIHAERDLRMGATFKRTENFKLPIADEFVVYLNAIVSEHSEDSMRLGDWLVQSFANTLERVDTFSGKFEEFWIDFEPILGNMFNDIPFDKIKKVFRTGLKLTQEHLLDEEWYDELGQAECFIGGFKMPSTLILKFYDGKEKPGT